jgi:hypothetical protein
MGFGSEERDKIIFNLGPLHDECYAIISFSFPKLTEIEI